MRKAIASSDVALLPCDVGTVVSLRGHHQSNGLHSLGQNIVGAMFSVKPANAVFRIVIFFPEDVVCVSLELVEVECVSCYRCCLFSLHSTKKRKLTCRNPFSVIVITTKVCLFRLFLESLDWLLSCPLFGPRGNDIRYSIVVFRSGAPVSVIVYDKFLSPLIRGDDKHLIFLSVFFFLLHSSRLLLENNGLYLLGGGGGGKGVVVTFKKNKSTKKKKKIKIRGVLPWSRFTIIVLRTHFRGRSSMGIPSAQGRKPPANNVERRVHKKEKRMKELPVLLLVVTSTLFFLFRCCSCRHPSS